MTTWLDATLDDVEIIPGVIDQEKVRTLHNYTSLNFFMKNSGLKNKSVEKLTEVAIPYMIDCQKRYSELLGMPMSDYEISEWMASETFKKHLSFLVKNAMLHDLEYWKEFYEFYKYQMGD